MDWGEFQDVFGDGVKIHCFVMVLCHSRLLYIEFTRSERFEDFIRCHENAIRYFDGRVPMEWWYDNLPTAVVERLGKLVRFNARFLAYVGHHHVSPVACNRARGNEKGRVENGVKYVRYNFWPNREFKDFEDLCGQAADWRDNTANLREHRSTRRIPRFVFDHEEKTVLRNSNPEPYDTDEIFSETIRPDFHIIFETNSYSVPWTLVGCVVTVRVNAGTLRVYYRDRFVTQHERCYRKHQEPFTQPDHVSGLLEIKPKAKNEHLHWQVRTLESYGDPLKQYLKCLRHSHRSLRSEVSTLLALGTVYGEVVLAETIGQLIQKGTIGIEQVEMALKHREKSENTKTRPAPMNLKSEILARVPARIDLRQYDQLCFSPSERSGEPDEPAEQTQGSQETSTHEPIQSKPGRPDEKENRSEPAAASGGAKPDTNTTLDDSD